MNALVVADCLGLRQFAGSAINPAVNAPALDRVGRLCPLPLHPFEIGKAGAILELVDHPRRNIGLVRPQRRGQERKLGLEIHGKDGLAMMRRNRRDRSRRYAFRIVFDICEHI